MTLRAASLIALAAAAPLAASSCAAVAPPPGEREVQVPSATEAPVATPSLAEARVAEPAVAVPPGAVPSIATAPAPTPSDSAGAAAPAIDLAGVLAPLLAEHGVPALGAAVVGGGRVTALGVAGVRRAGHAEPVARDDAWQLGSCTKAMTATALARLVDAGVLEWTRTLGEALPELDASMHPAYREVTLRHLADHRAGFAASTVSGAPFEAWAAMTEPVTERRLARVRALLAEPPAQESGTYVYSNSSYITLGAVIERATGERWEDVMLAELFQPLGMGSAGFGTPGRRGGHPGPWGHRETPLGTWAIPPDSPLAAHPESYGPAGTVYASLGDWARFAALHLGCSPAAPPLLAGATLEAMHAPVPGCPYACGFAVGTDRRARGAVLAHDGANAGWYASLRMSVADGCAVLAVCNHGGERGARACRAVVDALFLAPLPE